MEILFAADLHGQAKHFDALADRAREFEPDLLLFGGDILIDGDLDDPLGSQVQYLLNDMRAFLERLRSDLPQMMAATIMGNHEWLCTAEAMEALENKGLIRLVRPGMPTRVGPITMLGYWCAPPCPYPVKDFERLDHPDQRFNFDSGIIWDPQRRRPVPVDPAEHLASLPTIQAELDGLAAPQDGDWIFVCHAPPAQTVLDELTDVGHVGSQAVKKFILQHQPVLSLHGHIHDSPRLSGRYFQQLGSTIAVNPGQRDDVLAAVLVEIAAESFCLTPLGIEPPVPDNPISLPKRMV